MRGVTGAGLAGAVIVVALGCSAPAEPECGTGEARECACVDGARGARFCSGGAWGACECLEADAGTELDAGHDAGAPRDAGSDAGRDAGPMDAGHDAGTSPRDAGADECNVVTQVGCDAGQACRRTMVEGGPGNLATGPAECQYDGPLAEGDDECSIGIGLDRVDRCRAGLFCHTWDRCVRYCTPGGPSSQCPPLGGTPADQWGCVTDGPAGIPYCGRL